jgi:hypothetical protein
VTRATLTQVFKTVSFRWPLAEPRFLRLAGYESSAHPPNGVSSKHCQRTS